MTSPTHGFHADDFAHTANLLRSENDALRDATASNNHNIILAALDMAASGYALPSGEYGELVAQLNNQALGAELRDEEAPEGYNELFAFFADLFRQAARAISSLSAEREILQTALGAMRATIKGELGELILDLGRVEGSLDSQTYDEMRKQDDWPDDAEFHVVLTARDLRKISEANTLLVRTMMNALNATEEVTNLRSQLAALGGALSNA